MKNLIVLIFAIAGLLDFVPALSCYAKNNNPKNQYTWINVGLGTYNVSCRKENYSYNSLFTKGFTLSYQNSSHLFSFQVLNGSPVDMLDMFGSEPEISFLDVGILYGQCVRSSSAMLSISIGISKFHYVDCGELIKKTNPGSYPFGSWDTYEYDEIEYDGIGVPVVAQFFAIPSHFFAIGCCGFVNFNKFKSGPGLLFSIQFGELR